MCSVAPKSMTQMEKEEIKHVLVLLDSTSVMIEVNANRSDSDTKKTKIFDFYSATSYNSEVHVLDYGNTNTQLPPRVSC